MKNKLFNIRTAITCCTILLLFKAGITNAQDVTTNKRMQQIAKPGSKPGWVKFRDDLTTTPENLFREQKEAFGLGNDDEMKVKKTTKDEIGTLHYRYEQFYKGIRIDGAEYIVHSRNGKVYAANGKMVNGLVADKTTALPESAALELAKRATGAKHFKWEDRKAEAWLKKRKKNAAATYFPKGELVWCKSPAIKELDAKNYKLAWKFNIHADTTGTSGIMFIDAASGKVIKKLPLEMTCDISTSYTTYDGVRNLRTNKEGDNKYIMQYDCTSSLAHIHIRNANTSQTLDYATEYSSTNNVWSGFDNTPAAQSMFSIYESLRYYKDRHERDSYDEDQSEVEVYNGALFKNGNKGLTAYNASWSPDEEVIRVGMAGGMTGDEFNTMDILGHEFTHAVVSETANLEYINESGALNESFADIFGECVEFYSRGSCDWLHGVEKGGQWRSFIDPNTTGQPKYYYDSLFVPTGCSDPDTMDYCGVHKNSGVQNHWFYLLSMGGSGRNHNNRPFNIYGIGIQKAEKIAYLALTQYLTSTSNYYDAREASIRAAEELYGTCSNEAIQCAQAWYACSVGEALKEFDITVCGMPGVLAVPTDFWAINSIKGGGICWNIVGGSLYGVNYVAGEQVVLLPGFTAQSGSNFNAYIEPCATTNYLMPQKPRSSEAIARVADNAVAQKINVSTETSVQAYPNPFTNQLRIEIKAPKSAEAIIRMFDISGREITAGFTRKMLNAGTNIIPLNVSGIAHGSYIISIEMNGEKVTKKVVKQ